MSSYFEPCLTAAQQGALNAVANGTTVAPIVRPDLAPANTVIAGVLNTYSAWTDIAVANDLAAHMLTELIWNFGAGSTGGPSEFQIQIGTGAAGAEVVRGTWKDVWDLVSNVGSERGNVIPVWPPVQIPANARVAFRWAGNAGGTVGLTLAVSAQFYPRPLA